MTKDCAVVAYVDNDKWCPIEVWWLYRSWIYTSSCERSDLIIFYNPQINQNDLPQGKGIILIPLKPLYEEDPLWEDYHRINNTYFLTTKQAEIVKDYKYTLRTDVDCFLTKNFVHFHPRLATFGLNLYSTTDPNVGYRITDICRQWGVKQFHMNADCNCMANSWNILEYAKLQMQVAKKLKLEEFTEGHGEWPSWYEYVINMYSAGIAANCFFGMGYFLGGLGCMSMSEDPIGSTDFHIHAWHTEQNFSKLKWRDGYYDVIDHEALDDHIVNSYCAKMAGRRG